MYDRFDLQYVEKTVSQTTISANKYNVHNYSHTYKKHKRSKQSQVFFLYYPGKAHITLELELNGYYMCDFVCYILYFSWFLFNLAEECSSC